jgi:hypothetical protein
MDGTSSQAMNNPLTYPDQLRDDNLVEFFLNLIGASLKRSCLHYWFGSSTSCPDLRHICSIPA